ncbi:MAG: hypothetical protein ACXU86_06325 [Archangium sp.]
MFSATSRYALIPDATYTAPDGTVITYKQRRFPSVPRGTPVGQAVVRPGERLDLLSTRTLRDPLQFWRLCDLNDVMDPFELVDEPGRQVLVPLAVLPEPR